MTSTGMAVTCFLICISLFLFIILSMNQEKQIYQIQPFPNVVLVSPLDWFLNQMKIVAERILLYKKALLTGKRIDIDLLSNRTVFRVKSLDAYRGLFEEARKKAPSVFERKKFLKFGDYEKLIEASFEFNGVLFVYKPCVTLTNNGYILSEHIDVARVIILALNGEGPEVNILESNKDLIKSLLSMVEKYRIEVARTE